MNWISLLDITVEAVTEYQIKSLWHSIANEKKIHKNINDNNTKIE